MPDELWHCFKNHNYIIATSFKTYGQYITNMLAAMKKSDLNAIDNVIKGSETTDEAPSINQNFNHSFIWPMMVFVVENMPEIQFSFIPTEYVLSSSKELYKADACLLVDEIELSILETSGKLFIARSQRQPLRSCECPFYMLDKILFVCGLLRFVLWNYTVPKKICISKVPRNMTESADILALGNLCWCYKGHSL
ncbi:MAG: hypothetical protein EXX96DRAFT_650034 [Benjaminiella poitrasii]|nr:MAG: hypothetical protein EXX96DRAFT_650034 [Benjaminiella poitrasii]